MKINLINKETINNSYRADEVHFYEIEVKDINDIDKEFAEKFIRDIIDFNFRLEFTQETWEDIKMIIEDKLYKIVEFPMGFLKNDGTVMPLLANYILENIFKVKLLSYSEDLTELELVPKGFDSISFDENYNLFLCEYKSSITKDRLNEDKVSNLFIEGYKSIFCKNSDVISKISTIKSRLSKVDEEGKDKIICKLKQLQINRKKLETLIEKEGKIKFNICCMSKNSKKLNLNTIMNKIDEKFEPKKYCKESTNKYCRKFETCNKINKISVTNIIIIKIPDQFDMKSFYDNVLKIVEEKLNE